MKRLVKLVGISVGTTAVICGVLFFVLQMPIGNSLKQRIFGRKTVADQVSAYGEQARKRLEPFFQKAGVSYPPAEVKLLFLKSEKTLSLFAAGSNRDFKLIRVYSVRAASGKPGPKLKEGDRQVPEGIYRVEALNPNSAYHLSLRLNYPNEDDRRYGVLDSRTNLGSDIMIHGKAASIGCVAIGDEAIEEVFTLAADTRYQEWKVILAPNDLLGDESKNKVLEVTWLPELYTKIRNEMRTLTQTK